MEHVQRQSNGLEIMPYLVYVKIHMLMGKRLGCLISRKNYCVSIFHTAQIHPAGFVHVQKRHLIMSLQVAILDVKHYAVCGLFCIQILSREVRCFYFLSYY